jgi:hypothetical protein
MLDGQKDPREGAAYGEGFAAGQCGDPLEVPAGIDGSAFIAGFIEGRAKELAQRAADHGYRLGYRTACRSMIAGVHELLRQLDGTPPLGRTDAEDAAP